MSSFCRILAFLILPFMAHTPCTQATRQTNISLGSSLTASDGASWLSPSGRFAFGFYPKGQGFAVGVWLLTRPERTVLWTADRDDPPITGGNLWLTYDGRLTWTAPGGLGKTISQGTEPAAAAAMMDDGNFVLYNSNEAVIWSTFSSPTDTLLPGQSLLPNNQMFSSASEADRSTGMYRLHNQNDGNVVLYPVDTSDTSDDAYWGTDTFKIGFLLTLSLSSNGVLYLSGDNGSYTKNITQAKSSSSLRSPEVYYRATIDVDGILRVYSHEFTGDGANSTMSIEWAALDNRCLVRGVCGFNSYCSLNTSREPSCHCPPGFDFVDASQILLGCTRKTSAGDCASPNSVGVEGLTMVSMKNTTWVNKFYSILPSTTSLDDCKAACLSDCFCHAALFKDDQCTKQMLPLRYGRTGSNDTLFIKIGESSIGRQAIVRETKNKVLVDVLAATLSLAIICILVLVGSVLYRKRSTGRYLRTSEYDELGGNEGTPMRSYSYEELETATEGFKQQLGKGSFGTVFKGSLTGGDRVVAVKRLEKMVEDGEKEFQREVKAIGKTHHRNLVRLLGFCNEGSNRLLVYEYVSNGSLASHLFKAEKPPSWPERCRIALDVAKGLHYLHEELENHIIHCDIKPQNILIDASGTAKIADFGLAKLLMPDQTRTYTGVRGTRGYLAPEWFRNAPVTVKADVYSYGVVLLEIICCRRSMELEEAGIQSTLSQWAHECLMAGELGRLITDEIMDDAELERMVKIAIWCVQDEPTLRPSIRNVILMLEDNMEVSSPPAPTS